jgi:transcriptional regulator with XRE-family HTH domain
MKFSEKITTLRKINGLTQASLADKIGVTDKAVSKWESDGGMPDLGQIDSLCKVFNISLDYLLKDNVMSENDKAVFESINKYNKELLDKTENDELIKKCKNYLNMLKVNYTNDIFPFIENGKINHNCFVITNDYIGLNYDELVKRGQVDVVSKLFSDRVSIKDAITLDSLELFDIAAKSYEDKAIRNGKNNYKIKDDTVFEYIHASDDKKAKIDERKMLDKYFDDNNLDLILENLDPELNNYFAFIVNLIDLGAVYLKTTGYGYDVVCWT